MNTLHPIKGHPCVDYSNGFNYSCLIFIVNIPLYMQCIDKLVESNIR